METLKHMKLEIKNKSQLPYKISPHEVLQLWFIYPFKSQEWSTSIFPKQHQYKIK